MVPENSVGYLWDMYERGILEMDERAILQLLSGFMLLSAFITFAAMYFMKLRASYGRYSSQSLLAKYSVPAKVAWSIQECPSLILPLIALWQVGHTIEWTNLLIVLMFAGHYFQRSLIYPFLIRGGKPTPVHLMLLGIIFCSWNGYIQGFFHAKYALYPSNHLFSFGSLIGIPTFFTGMFINIHSDHILRNLRRKGETGYKIPRGGAFDLVSGANFFGEIVEWFGYALFAQTLPAWAFSLFTMANTIPRAVEHHRWYQQKFDDYPKERKAVIPYIL
ncbi:3-oxo-5-alpha-steroid 4-dehydrogenase domain-containing protein [Ditylenchus destructor]|nr:3-oxo-5-alpha-steroid 4-dehydrogenase domain-containing protein [Ditylenchus destructor]